MFNVNAQLQKKNSVSYCTFIQWKVVQLIMLYIYIYMFKKVGVNVKFYFCREINYMHRKK